jgi:hypothetical protein
MEINQVGLVTDIIGFLLLLKFGMPSEYINQRGPYLIGDFTDAQNEQIAKSNKKIKIGSTIGTCLVLLGFLFQLIGTFGNRVIPVKSFDPYDERKFASFEPQRPTK